MLITRRAAALALLALAGCTASVGHRVPPAPVPSTAHTVQLGTVSGRLILSVGVTSAQPAAGTVTLLGTDSSSQVVKTGTNGAYQASLRPGTYVLEGHSPSYGSYVCSGQPAVTVVAATTTTQDVYCVGK
jgi:hypothetical protein